jgi:hypothetical protein
VEVRRRRTTRRSAATYRHWLDETVDNRAHSLPAGALHQVLDNSQRQHIQATSLCCSLPEKLSSDASTSEVGPATTARHPRTLRFLFHYDVDVNAGQDGHHRSAAQLAMSIAPPDDAGARTADLFEWQAAMSAADGLRLYLDALDDSKSLPETPASKIVCEYHEDWMLVHEEKVELVSAKHKEPSFGAFSTVHQLLDAGGVAHLFQRWHVLEEKPLCRLVTTAGLKAGQTQRLAAAAVQLREQRLARRPLVLPANLADIASSVVTALLGFPKMLPDGWKTNGAASCSPATDRENQVRRFLSVLTFQYDNPGRLHVSYAAPGLYVAPVLKRLDKPAELAPAVWEAVLTLFRVRMRAAGPRPEGGLPRVLAYPHDAAPSGPAETERELVSRIVSLTDIDLAIRQAVKFPTGFAPLPTLVRSSRLAIKMEAGHCQDNSVERAEHLVRDYRNYWRERGNGDPTARARQQRLTRVLLKIADDAGATAADATHPWGQSFWRQLQAHTERLDPSELPPGMDTDLLLGGICDLASQCKVWFSAAFNVEARIADVRTRLEEGG